MRRGAHADVRPEDRRLTLDTLFDLSVPPACSGSPRPVRRAVVGRRGRGGPREGGLGSPGCCSSGVVRAGGCTSTTTRPASSSTPRRCTSRGWLPTRPPRSARTRCCYALPCSTPSTPAGPGPGARAGGGRDLIERGGMRAMGASGCGPSSRTAGRVPLPVDFLQQVGFQMHRPHPRYPRIGWTSSRCSPGGRRSSRRLSELLGAVARAGAALPSGSDLPGSEPGGPVGLIRRPGRGAIVEASRSL